MCSRKLSSLWHWNIWWKNRDQQDATNLMFIIKLLSQHVSGIIMPFIRRTRVCTAAYGVLHWLWWLWLCGAGTRAVSRTVTFTVHTARVPSPHNHSHHNHRSCVHCECYCSNSIFHNAHSPRPSSTQPQTAQPVQNTICGSAHSCSPDDGHNDVRNMLR